jgi:hypothetical protein
VIKVEPTTCHEGYLQCKAQQHNLLGSANGFLQKLWYRTQSGCQILILEFLEEALMGDIQTILTQHPQCFMVDAGAAIMVQMVS